MKLGQKTVGEFPKRSLVLLTSLVVVLTGMFALVAVDRTTAARSLNTFVGAQDQPIPEFAPALDLPSALWVGDSFTQGGAAYPRIVCAQLGWYCNIDAQGGTGYINAGEPESRSVTSRFIDRLPTSVDRYKADLIIVDGGRSDLSSDPADLIEAMETYIDALRVAWPAAKLVIVVPFFLETEPSFPYSSILDGIDELASSSGAQVLDPYSEGWFEGADVGKMVIADGVHPNAMGNSYIAAKTEASLERAGVVSPESSNGVL